MSRAERSPNSITEQKNVVLAVSHQLTAPELGLRKCGTLYASLLTSADADQLAMEVGDRLLLLVVTELPLNESRTESSSLVFLRLRKTILRVSLL